MNLPMNHAIDTYFAAKAEVQAMFGYVGDWVEIPMRDQRGDHWMLVNGEGVGGYCVYSDKPLTAEILEAGEEIYGGPIYTQRFLKKWVYRTPTHVLVAVNTQTDGNRFLCVFDADKECTDDRLRAVYREHWVEAY